MFNENGYAKLPGGLILQWGVYRGVSRDVNFNIRFPNKCLNVIVCNNFGTGDYWTGDRHTKVGTWTNEKFSCFYEMNGISWMAIGY